MRNLLALIFLMLPLALRAEMPDRLNLNGVWSLKSSEHLAESGEQISVASYVPSGWMPAPVPGTTLGAYVANKIFPEPTYDRNNQLGGLIPDISVPGSVFTFPHWWRTSFTVPAAWWGQTLWLNLDGVNWSAEIFVNGTAAGSMKGAFKRGIFDITALATTGTNVLAIKIIPPVFPGIPKAHGCAGQGGDNNIGRTPATINQTVGWDFTFVDGVRDRDTGIYRDVFLTATGPVRIADPFMRTVGVPGESATLAFRTWLVNATDQPQKGTLKLAFEGGNGSVEVELAARESREITLDHADCSGLVVKHPRLWWPNGRGKAELYDLNVSFTIGGKVSDSTITHFGIRSIEHETDFHGQSTWKVNGKRLFMPGGAWVQDALLRQSPKRYDAEIRMIAQTGLTWLRIWSGSGPESDEFFNTCDRYGIMVWVEAGLTTGQTPIPSDKPDYPAFKKCIFANLTDTVLRLRNHPSVFYWCGSNEGPDINGMKDIVLANDGTRDYQPNSQDFGQAGSIYVYQGIASLYDYTGNGPWFGGPLGIFAGFCNESSNPNLPNIECLREQMPEVKLWPIDEETFKYQDGGGFHNILGFIQKGCSSYGNFSVPDMAGRVGADNYAFKGQLLGAMQYRADSELWQRNKWDATGKWATGYAMWTANTTHPQAVSRLYHYDLEPNMALWFMAHGNKPLHVQYDYYANDVSAVNNSWKDAANLTVKAEIRNLDWSLKWSGTTNIANLSEETSRNGLISVPSKGTAGLDDVHFVNVELKDAAGNTMDDMIYWRSRRDDNYGCDGSFVALNAMPPATLKVATKVRAKNGRQFITATLTNPGKGLAFFIRLKLLGAANKKLIHPTYYGDNGFSIQPGQNKTVTIEVNDEDLAGERPMLGVEGWNVGIATVAVPGKITTPALAPLGDAQNLALCAQTVASGGTCPAGSDSQAVDGNLGTAWTTAGEKEPWLQLNLGSLQRIDRAKLSWGTNSAKSWKLLASCNGRDWEEVHEQAQVKSNTEEVSFNPVAAHYVKLVCSADSALSLAEIAVYGLDPLPPRQDLAIGKPIKVSSERNGPWSVIKSVVDFPNSCWVSEGGDTPQWLQVDLSSEQKISSVQINWKVCYASAFQIQVSDDGNTWKDAYSTDTGEGNIEEINFPPITGRYVRLFCTRHGYDNGYWLHGFKVFAAPEK